jgi:hypothetical protein
MLLSPVEREVCAAHGAEYSRASRVVHSGNLGDVLYSLPAVRALGTSRYLLNLCSDPGLWQRRLTLDGARFLRPLLLMQPCIAAVEIVRAPILLRDMEGQLVADGLPLEGAEPDALGSGTHIFDRFRAEPELCTKHLIRSHADAVGALVDETSPFIEVPGLDELRARAAEPDAPVVVSLTPRYRTAPTKFFTELLRHCPYIVKIGVAAEAHVYEDLPGQCYTAPDALALARLIARARLFIGAPSMPYAIAEGLKVPRLVDVFRDLPNAFPLGELGWHLSGDLATARSQLDAVQRHAWQAPALLASAAPLSHGSEESSVLSASAGLPSVAVAASEAGAHSQVDAAGPAQKLGGAPAVDCGMAETIARLERERQDLRCQIEAILGSRSWRWGEPLRRVSALMRRTWLLSSRHGTRSR